MRARVSCYLFLSVFCFAIGLAGVGPIQAGDTNAPLNRTAGKNPIHLVDVVEAESLIAQKKVVILDVRTPKEFTSGHLTGATNLDFHSKDFAIQLERLNKEQPYLVHCAVGGRSARACKLMSEMEFTAIYDLKGGIQAWERAGKPTTK